MKIRKAYSILFLAAIVLGAASNRMALAQTTSPVEMVGEGTVSSTGDEYGGSITADGESIYFTRSVPHSYLYTLCVSHLDNSGHWGRPEILPFSGQWRDSDPVLSPSGDRLLFISDRPAAGESATEPRFYRIWSSRKTAAGWAKPELWPIAIAENVGIYFASIAANGNLYFTALDEKTLGLDVWISRLVDGKYQPAEPLAALNGDGIVNVEAFIAPDESYILLGSRGRADSLGASDLYISYNRDGQWSAPKNLGPQINSSARDSSPRVTPDGKYLIFNSERGFFSEKHEGTMSNSEFVRASNSVLNGLGNIYRVPMSYVFEVAKP